MKEIKRFQIRGVAGDISRVEFDGRILDYWLPKSPARHLLIAHDGQNIFDGHTSTHRGQTWQMAQSAIRVSQTLGIDPHASMGALATLYALAQFPDRFTTALALSSHWPFGGRSLVEMTVQSLPKPGAFKVWMSHGTKGIDAEYAPYQLIANRLMHEHGYQHHNFVSKVYKRSGHNERLWAKYLDQPMRFWLEAATPLEPQS